MRLRRRKVYLLIAYSAHHNGMHVWERCKTKRFAEARARALARELRQPVDIALEQTDVERQHIARMQP